MIDYKTLRKNLVGHLLLKLREKQDVAISLDSVTVDLYPPEGGLTFGTFDGVGFSF